MNPRTHLKRGCKPCRSEAAERARDMRQRGWSKRETSYANRMSRILIGNIIEPCQRAFHMAQFGVDPRAISGCCR